MAPSGGQICNSCKWCHLVAKFATNASGAIWWSNLQLMQVAPSGGQICNWCKWCHLVAFGTNASGILFILTYNFLHLDHLDDPPKVVLPTSLFDFLSPCLAQSARPFSSSNKFFFPINHQKLLKISETFLLN